MEFGRFPDLYPRFPALAPAGARIALIATIPRSGTWALQYFFSALHSLAKHDERANPFDIAFAHLPEIGFDLFSIAHHYCPGLDAIGDARFKEWQALVCEPLPGWDWGSAELARYAAQINLGRARIVFLYRNPLDAAVSFCRQMQRPHNAHYAGAIRDDDKRSVDVADIGGFLRRVGARNYLKYFLSYWWGRALWGERLLFLRYEDLAARREETLTGLLAFLAGRPLDPAEAARVRAAAALSSAEALRALEQRRNRSIGDPGDKAGGENHRHLVDGRTGVWRDLVPAEDAAGCRRLMSDWGIPDTMFRYE